MRRLAALVVLALALAGCHSPGEGSPVVPSSSPTTAGLRTETTSVGTVLADSAGRTLYLLTADRGGRPTCTGTCLGVWPPVMVSGTPPAPSGVSATFGTVATTGGRQLTVDGYPAYTYVGDSGPEQVNGQGIVSYGGTWYALGITGRPIEQRRVPTPAGSPGSGY